MIIELKSAWHGLFMVLVVRLVAGPQCACS